MTLVLALAAQDGVVMVADGQATAGQGTMLTRTPARKLGVLHGRLLYGMAGHAGLRQRVVARLEQQISAGQCGVPIDELRPCLRAAVNEVQHEALSEHVRISLGSEPASVQVLVAGVPDRGDPWIYEITAEGHEEAHQRAEAIGSGRPYARYALMSADHYRLQERGLNQVRLLAYRAVDDAIRTDARDLGDPIMIAEATRDGARELDGDQVHAVKTSLIVWQQHEQEVFEVLPTVTGDAHGPMPRPVDERGVEPPPADG